MTFSEEMEAALDAFWHAAYEQAPVLAECLGHAIVAADSFFKLRTVQEATPEGSDND